MRWRSVHGREDETEPEPPEASGGQAQRCAPAGATNFGAIGACARNAGRGPRLRGKSGRGKFLAPGADVPSTAVGIHPCNRERQPERKEDLRSSSPQPRLASIRKRPAILAAFSAALDGRHFGSADTRRWVRSTAALPRQPASRRQRNARRRTVAQFQFSAALGSLDRVRIQGAPMGQARERQGKARMWR